MLFCKSQKKSTKYMHTKLTAKLCDRKQFLDAKIYLLIKKSAHYLRTENGAKSLTCTQWEKLLLSLTFTRLEAGQRPFAVLMYISVDDKFIFHKSISRASFVYRYRGRPKTGPVAIFCLSIWHFERKKASKIKFHTTVTFSMYIYTRVTLSLLIIKAWLNQGRKYVSI